MKDLKTFREKIVKWRGIRNHETRQTDGGYLFFRCSPTRNIGIPIHNVRNKKEAIAAAWRQYQDGLLNIIDKEAV